MDVGDFEKLFCVLVTLSNSCCVGDFEKHFSDYSVCVGDFGLCGGNGHSMGSVWKQKFSF